MVPFPWAHPPSASAKLINYQFHQLNQKMGNIFNSFFPPGLLSYREDTYKTATQIRKTQSQVPGPPGLPWLCRALCSSMSCRQRRALSFHEHSTATPCASFGGRIYGCSAIGDCSYEACTTARRLLSRSVCVSLGAISLSLLHGHPTALLSPFSYFQSHF